MTNPVSSIPVYITSAAFTPLGPVWVAVSKHGLERVEIQARPQDFAAQLESLGFGPVAQADARAGEAARQVSEYLSGERQVFDYPIDWDHMPTFQRQVLQATFAIPYGQTRTYAGIARQIDRPRAARAVGRAEATNPMPLVIPCHRVLGSDGKLHGYGAAGGLETKAWLLRLEQGG